MAEAPPPPPSNPDEEAHLFDLFRVLRERVFQGSRELVSRVMLGVQEQIQGVPEESIATAMLTQLTNFVTSWIEPEAAAPRRLPGRDDEGNTDDAPSPPSDENGTDE